MKRITLTVIEGPSKGMSITSSLGQTPIVGRSSTSDFTVLDPRMSREHFKLVGSENGWLPHDLGSSNGTLVNGSPIDDGSVLAEGDIVTAGDTQFCVSFDDTRWDRSSHLPSAPSHRELGNRRAWKKLLWKNDHRTNQ